VWYPSGVAVGWVPYRLGHWAWIEPWGWTWVGAEPWGFCPYHYGRWALIGARWGWVPGPVAVVPWYAPALVAFVGGGGFSLSIGFGSGGVAAWFPLGPSDPFIPWYHYQGNYIRQVNITNVRNVTNITNITNVTNIHYAYREVATTAVPANVFRSGQPVTNAAVHVTPQQLAHAQVVAHPEINPARTAVFAGKPALQAPPLRVAKVTPPPPARPNVLARPAPGARPAPETTAPQPPVPGRPAPGTRPPPENAAQELHPAPPTRTTPELHASPPQGHAPSTPPPQRPTFITRTPPPPHDVPFSAHEPAMQQHPGRPLEPQQEENLRQARPPGPPQDREVLPHAAPPPKEQPHPAPQAPPPRGKSEH
jgi:hypothetical protein